jgi:hypothetical protein
LVPLYLGAVYRSLGSVEVNGKRMDAIYGPPATNDGSMFMHHVVLVWSVNGHTYGFGFHNTRGIRRTLLLDKQLAAHFKLVRP